MAGSSPSVEPQELAGQRVLVAGSSGFLGSHLVEALIRKGATVAALSRTEGRLSAIGARGFQFLRCDLTDAQQARQAIGSFAPRILYHLAAHPDGKEDFKQADRSIQLNLAATLNALEALRLCGGELFVYGDSCKVYGECDVPYRASMPLKPTSSYAIAKAAGWQMCDLYRRLYGLATVSVRPTLIYGPRQGFNFVTYVANCVRDGQREVRLDGGAQTRDPLYVDDAMEAFLAVGEKGRSLSGQVINIGGGSERSVTDLARLILEVMASQIPVVEDPARMRPTEMQRSYCDNLEAGRLLGWQPRTDLRVGFERTIQSLREAAHSRSAAS